MRIGTRGSDLALWQARLVRALLLDKAGVEAEIVIIKTQGDKDQVTTFENMQGKGFWTKEIEAALLDGSVDLAVHSLKDLQTEMPPGLALGAVLNRADRRDVLLMRPETHDSSQYLNLKQGAKVGTTSARRVAQLRFLRPDLDLQALRGNVPTRVRKVREGAYDAIMLATAGIDRLELDLDGLVVERLPETVFVPAPGQGALAIQIRDDDPNVSKAVKALDEVATREIVWLEREILRQLEGGCQLPLGSAADPTADGYHLRLFLGGSDGTKSMRIVVDGKEPHEIADAAVNYLRRQPTYKNAGNRPANVWITREPGRAGDYSGNVAPSLANVSPIPVSTAIEAGDKAQQKSVLEDLAQYDWIIFTSQITVTQFKLLLDRHSAEFGSNTKLGAVGRKTASAMKNEGWGVDFVSAVADAVSLGSEFTTMLNGEETRILFPCSVRASDDLENTITTTSITLDRLECYDTLGHPDLSATVAALPTPNIIAFTSPSAARFLLDTGTVPADIIPLSIGPSTTAALRKRGFPIVWESVDRSLEGLAEVTNGILAR